MVRLLINSLIFYLKLNSLGFFFLLQILINVSFPVYRLEETLIELYLSGHSNKTIDGAFGVRVDDANTPTDGL